jgi:hypothetical protein
LSPWRGRLGAKLELLLAQTLRIARQAGSLHTKNLARVTVDTAVQPKAINFPTMPSCCMPPSRASTNWPKARPIYPQFFSPFPQLYQYPHPILVYVGHMLPNI